MEKKIKIGVITFWGSKENYGQLLQMYALQEYLKALGYEPYLIRYNRHLDKSLTNHILPKKNIFRYFKRILQPKTVFNHIFQKIQNKVILLLQEKERAIHPRYFDDFIGAHVKVSKKVYESIDELRKFPPVAEVYVTGSDVVWSSPRPAFYLSFGPPNIKRVSFAASFGRKMISDDERLVVEKYLKSFDLVTVRETQGMEICEKAGRNDSKVFLDPTLLLPKEHYSKISNKVELSVKFCFLYLLGNETDFYRKDISQVCKKNNLELIYTTCDRFDKYPKVYPTVNEWLWYFENAEVIVTNSYHGCIFAIIFNKNFIFLPLIKNYVHLNVRVESLLEKFKLMDRIYKNNFEELFNTKIDYSIINNQLSTEIMKMESILKSELYS